MDLHDCNLIGGMKNPAPLKRAISSEKNFIYIHVFVKCGGTEKKYLSVIQPVSNVEKILKLCESFVDHCNMLKEKA